MDSVFNLKRPYDLMALLKQEQRAVMLETLKRELLAKKGDIDKNEDKDTGTKSMSHACVLFRIMFKMFAK